MGFGLLAQGTAFHGSLIRNSSCAPADEVRVIRIAIAFVAIFDALLSLQTAIARLYQRRQVGLPERLRLRWNVISNQLGALCLPLANRLAWLLVIFATFGSALPVFAHAEWNQRTPSASPPTRY